MKLRRATCPHCHKTTGVRPAPWYLKIDCDLYPRHMSATLSPEGYPLGSYCIGSRAVVLERNYV